MNDAALNMSSWEWLNAVVTVQWSVCPFPAPRVPPYSWQGCGNKFLLLHAGLSLDRHARQRKLCIRQGLSNASTPNDLHRPGMALPTDLPGNTQADGRAVLLITTVDIGGGKSEKIELRAGDDPADAAREFCDKHSLPPTIMGPLTMHILENLRKAAEKASNAAKQAGSTTSETKGQQSSVKSPTQAESLPSAKQEKLSFANGMNDKLYEQLSAKLVDVDEGSRMVTVTANTNGRPLSSRQQGGGSTLASSVGLSADLRKASSAGPSPRDAVHNRLYNYATTVRNKQEAKRRAAKDEMAASMTLPRSSMSWISQEMMRDRTHGPFDNYGEMLYAEGLEAAAVQRSKASMVRAEREARELDGVTFAPEITQLAKTLWSGGDLDAQPAWQRLSINKQAKMMERIRDLQKQREDGEMRQCTFKPKINRHSANLMSERSEALKVLQVSAHDQLFQDAQRRQAKLSELQSWLPDDVTFAPQINRTGTAAAHLRHSLDALGLQKRAEGGAGDGSPGTADVRASVVDRLYMNYEKTKAKLEGKREQLNGPVDPVTGRQLYKPAVGRGPRNVARNQEGLSIGEYLYTNGMELVSKKEMALEEEREAERAAANLRHANSTSEKLYAQLRAKRFSQIFEYLDEAGDGMLDIVGLVRAATARMDNLDNE
ncbi:PFU domain-containing protein, partial [Haematococcus lacustris]